MAGTHRTNKEWARMLNDMSQNGHRAITLLCENRKPLREFTITYVSENDGYLAGREKDQKRVMTIKFNELKEIR